MSALHRNDPDTVKAPSWFKIDVELFVSGIGGMVRVLFGAVLDEELSGRHPLLSKLWPSYCGC